MVISMDSAGPGMLPVRFSTMRGCTTRQLYVTGPQAVILRREDGNRDYWDREA